MAKTRNRKNELVEFYKKSLDESTGVLFSNNPGLEVNAVTELKKKLYGVEAHFHVITNRLFKLAVSKDIDEELFEGPTTAIFTSGDITEVAKIFRDFAKDQKNKPEIKGGLIGEQFVNADRAKSLSEIPSKEVLLAKTLYMFNAPLSGLAQTLTGVQRNFVYALNAVKENKQ